MSYTPIKPKAVESENKTSNLAFKGTVEIQIDRCVVAEAYHATDLSSNILAGHLLSDMYEVSFSTSITSSNTCFLFKKGSLDKDDIIAEISAINGIFPIKFQLSASTLTQALETRKSNGN